MASENQKSRRISGDAPLPILHYNDAKQRSEFRSLLATNCRNGRAFFGGDPSRSWRLDGPSPAHLAAIRRVFGADSIRGTDATAEDDGIEDDSSQEGLRQLLFEGEEEEEDEEEVVVEEVAVEEEEEDSNLEQKHAAAARDHAGMKLIPFDQQKSLVETNCICKKCHSPLNLTQDTFGLATNLYLECACTNDDGRMKPHKSAINSNSFGIIDNKTTRKSAAIYTINYQFTMAMMMMGLGVDSVVNFLGMLGIRSSLGDFNTWKKIQDKIGVIMNDIAEECCVANQQKAIAVAEEKGFPKDG